LIIRHIHRFGGKSNLDEIAKATDNIDVMQLKVGVTEAIPATKKNANRSMQYLCSLQSSNIFSSS
jgi:hypothetical protein